MKSQIFEEILDSLKWWGKLRLWFNITCALFAIACIWKYGNGDPLDIAVSFSAPMIFANLFYFLGVGLEATVVYSSKGKYRAEAMRIPFLILGTIAMCLKIWQYVEAYYNYVEI